MALRIADATADLSAGDRSRSWASPRWRHRCPRSITTARQHRRPDVPQRPLRILFGGPAASICLPTAASRSHYDKAFFSQVGVSPVTLTILPATLTGTSIAGDVTLDPTANSQLLMMPSPQGELGLFAGGNIVGTTIGMMDADPGLLPGLFSSFSTPDGLGRPNGRDVRPSDRTVVNDRSHPGPAVQQESHPCERSRSRSISTPAAVSDRRRAA